MQKRGPTTPDRHRYKSGLGCSPVARHYWGNHCYFLFLEVLRCFSSLRSPHYQIVIITLQVIGLSHSEIRGSRDICSYPRLIAAYHVLRRLREPRHPPCALIYFLACALPKKKKGQAHTFSCFSFVICLCLNLQSCVSICQRSRPIKGWWRISGSNR